MTHLNETHKGEIKMKVDVLPEQYCTDCKHRRRKYIHSFGGGFKINFCDLIKRQIYSEHKYPNYKCPLKVNKGYTESMLAKLPKRGK